MIKQLSLFVLCTLFGTGQVQAMNNKNIFMGIASGALSCLDLQWWKKCWQELKPFSEELARNPLALDEACAEGDRNRVKALLAAGADVDSKGKYGMTPLHYASSGGHEEVVDLLLQNGACVDSKNNGRTPLHYARGCKEVVEVLLKHGASIDSKDNNGDTPLHLCFVVYGEYYEIPRLLACASFFTPCSSPRVLTQESTLQEQCLITTLRALDKFSEDGLITFLADDFPLDHLFHVVADCAPLKLQQALVTYWRQQASEKEDMRKVNMHKQKMLLNAHCNRHFNKLRDVMAIKNKSDETVCNIALRKKHQKTVKLLNHINQTPNFDQLDLALQEAIANNFKQRLLIQGL